MKKLSMIFFVAMATVTFSIESFAANTWCTGTLTGVYITSSGDVNIRGAWRGDWTTICNVKQSEATVTCSLWASYAATAVKDQLPVTLMYSQPDLTCPTLPTYGSSPVPVYLMLNQKPE